MAVHLDKRTYENIYKPKKTDLKKKSDLFLNDIPQPSNAHKIQPSPLYTEKNEKEVSIFP